MNHTAQSQSRHHPPAMLAGGGEMGERIQVLDWAKTPLGPVDEWPPSLKTAAQIVLNARQPMFIWWGPDRVHLYNDACIPILGARHPRALGRPAADAWAELWPVLGVPVDAALQEGRAARIEGLTLLVERDRCPGEGHFTFSYTPIPDEVAGEGGVLGTITDDTERVLSQRRLRTLQALAERADEAMTAAAACERAAAVLGENPRDLPFILIYLLDGGGREATLAGSAGLDRDAAMRLRKVAVEERGGLWPFRQVAETGRPIELDDLTDRLDAVRVPLWPQPLQRARVLPMTVSPRGTLVGFIVAGISPWLPCTEDYVAFLDLLPGHVSTAIAQAHGVAGEPPPEELEPLCHSTALLESLRVSEERLRLAAEATGFGTYDYDVATARSTWSDRLRQIVGVAEDGPVDPQQALVARIHPDDRAHFQAQVVRALDPAGSGEHEIEFRIVRDDGETRWLRNVGRVLFAETDGARRAVRAVGTVLDITAHRRTEEALQRTLAQSEAIFRQMTEGLVIFDPAGNLLDMNPAALAIHGFETVDGLRRHLDALTDIFELFDLEGRRLATGDWPIARVLRGETLSAYEVRVRRRDTGKTWIGSYGGTRVHGPGGAPVLAIVTLRDVTAQWEAEAALDRAKQRLETALTATELGVWHWDVQHNRVAADRNMLRLFGLDEDERALPLETYFACIHEADRGRIEAAVGRALAAGGPYEEEYRVIQPDGQFRWLHVRGRVDTDPQGAVLAFSGVAVDVTVRRQAEDRLRYAHGLIEGITQGTDDLIAAEDSEFRYIYFNDAYRREFKRLWGREVAHGMSMVEALAPWPEDLHKAQALWSRALNGESFSVTEEFGPSEPEKQVYDLRFNPVHDAQGRLIGAAHILHNVTERVRIQETLRQSEATLKAVLDALPVGVIIADAEGRILRDNAANRTLWGAVPEVTSWEQYGEWVGYWPESGRRIEAREWGMTRALLDGEVVHGELVECEQFGTRQRRFFLNNAAPIRDGEGRIIAGVVAELDVTDRLVAERALQESEERFRKVFENAAMGIAITDWEGRFQQCNPAFAALLGYTEAELRGTDFQSLVHPDDRAAKMDQIRRLKAGELPSFEIENRNMRKDGTPVWVRKFVSVLRDEMGRPAHLVSLVTDITERKLADRALQESESFYRQTLESIPGMTFTNAPDGACDYVSEQWVEFTGMPLAEHYGEGWLQTLHPEDRERAFTAWRAAVEGHGPHDLAYRVRRRDGEYEWFKVRGRAIRDAAGEVVRWFGTAVNVDDLKRAEAALRKAGRRKDEFLATLAHELRNPLAPLLHGLELMKLATSDAGPLEDTRAMMARQLGHMVRLVDDLLDVSRISRGKIELRREPVALAAVVRSAVEIAGPAVERAGHALAVEVPAEPLHVDADPARLAQVLANLLNNAAKFTEPGGHIRLSVARESEEAVMTVRDDGAGIPARLLSEIFEPFVQVDRSLERSQSGLGIGLTLVKQLVELHGGRVEARSEGPGFGSEFVVRLPMVLSPSVQVRPDDQPVRSAERGGQHRVLIVDDNQDAADSLAMLLKSMGNVTRIAYDGLAALEAGAAFRPDVIVLDIGMPGLNGYETAKRLRQQPWGEHAVLIALTGWGQEGDKRRSREAGFDHHLVKPIDIDALEGVLNALP